MMTSSGNSSQSTRTGRVLWEESLVLSRFTRNYERTSGILSPVEYHRFDQSIKFWYNYFDSDQ